MREWVTLANITITGVMVLLLGLASPAAAANLIWNTCDGGGNNTCNYTDENGVAQGVTPSNRTVDNFGTVETVFKFEETTDATKILEARSFKSANVDGTGNALKTTTTIWEGGLGSGFESTSDGQHGVDSVGKDEFVVFKLPADTYKPVSYTIGYKNTDADITTWIGGTSPGANDALALLLSSTPFDWNKGATLVNDYGFVEQSFPFDPASNVGNDTNSVNVGEAQLFSKNAAGRYLIIGTRHEGTTSSDGGEDRIKILQVVGQLVTPPPPPPGNVPEPGVQWLMLVATGAMVGALVRRRT